MTVTSIPDNQDIVPHLWLGGFVPGEVPEEQFTENVLSFITRNDLTVVLSAWNTTEEDAQRLDDTLNKLHSRNIDVWLGTYDLRDYTDKELATDNAKRTEDTKRLLRMVDVYTEYYPNGAVFTWHEPPNTGQWTGETRQQRAQSMAKYGPDIFSAQKTAVAERYPELDFGLMLWWHIVPPAEYTRAPIIEPLMEGLADRDALPDFVYFDFYRGYYEWSGGYEGVNDVIRASIENVKTHIDDRPVYYLGECHSVNNRYTPSKQSILGDLWTALDAGADSYGWYIRKSYKETHPRNYNPFLPNHGTNEYKERFNTMVGSRDRFIWAYQALLEEVRDRNPGDRFDLWLYGYDLNFYEHGVELRTRDGDWEYLGDISGYLDGSEHYSGDDRDRIVAFHGLERDRFLNDELTVRINSYEGGDGATLRGAYVAPHLDAAHYLTEPELTSLVAEQSDLKAYSLGITETDERLAPDSETRVDISIQDPTVPLQKLARSNQREAFIDLAEGEKDSEDAPSEQFDLWVYGADLQNVSVKLDDISIEEFAAPNDAGSAPEARVYRGLAREDFFERHSGGHYLDLTATAEGPGMIQAVFVMPYHGPQNFTSDTEASRIIERDYAPDEGRGQLTTFSLGHQLWPDGADLKLGDSVNTWVQVYSKRITLAGD